MAIDALGVLEGDAADIGAVDGDSHLARGLAGIGVGPAREGEQQILAGDRELELENAVVAERFDAIVLDRHEATPADAVALIAGAILDEAHRLAQRVEERDLPREARPGPVDVIVAIVVGDARIDDHPQHSSAEHGHQERRDQVPEAGLVGRLGHPLTSNNRSATSRSATGTHRGSAAQAGSGRTATSIC